jgi:heat shock protein HslJ
MIFPETNFHFFGIMLSVAEKPRTVPRGRATNRNVREVEPGAVLVLATGRGAFSRSFRCRTPGDAMTYPRILAMAAVLIAVFVFGMSLTAAQLPFGAEGFPLNRRFIAVSLNGEPFNYERMHHLPSLEVRRNGILKMRAFGHGGCNAWNGDVEFPSGKAVLFKNTATTRMACADLAAERRYLDALLKATRWRAEDRTLILENGNDTLRFHLAPS